jgi:hypothetical protein
VHVGIGFKSRLMARLFCLGALTVDDDVSQRSRGHKLRGGAKGFQFALPLAALLKVMDCPFPDEARTSGPGGLHHRYERRAA